MVAKAASGNASVKASHPLDMVLLRMVSRLALANNKGERMVSSWEGLSTDLAEILLTKVKHYKRAFSSHEECVGAFPVPSHKEFRA